MAFDPDSGYCGLMTTEETIEHLTGLIPICKDSERGYHEAAETVRDAHLISIFNEYGKQRDHFARDLQTEVERLGGSPPDHGSVGAMLQRGWMDLKAVVSGGDARPIIAVCETAEDAAEAAFDSVLNTGISGHSRTLVEKQWRKIQEARQHLLRLKAEIPAGPPPA